jgi:iron-sulfur cluster repair protein YtfE (RIC family)
MEDEMSYERLIAEHARIDAILGRLKALVEADQPCASLAMLALSDLSSELSHHLEHEDSFIYPRMIVGQDQTARDVAWRFVTDFAALREDWQVYLAEWNTECIVEDWAMFCRESEAMIARIARRVRAENELLYTAALASGAIQLRERRKAA